MFSGNNNYMLPISLDENGFQCKTYPTNNQLQLFGNVPAGCTDDPVNHFGNGQSPSILHPSKCGREAEDLSRQQKLQISLNYNFYQDEVDCSASIPNQHPVSTGLRLSCDDDERNSSVTSASGRMTAGPSILLSLADSLRTKLQQQKEEFDQYIKIQEEHLAKGVRDMKRRHIASFLSTIEKGLNKKLQEKELELENMNRKNRELMERIKQVATEAHTWQNRAKYNESVVNVLKTNLEQAISHGADQRKEGFGDSEVDDAASYIDPTMFLGAPGIPGGRGKGTWRNLNENLICKACGCREVSILLMPCRHLCVCKDCDALIGICPVCNGMKTASVEVYLP